MTHFRSVAGWLFVLVIFSPAAAPAAEDWQALSGQDGRRRQTGGAGRRLHLAGRRAPRIPVEAMEGGLSRDRALGAERQRHFLRPGVAIERSAGQYLWDVFDSGPNTGYSAIKAGLLDPLLPELILPEVNDPAVWGGWTTPSTTMRRIRARPRHGFGNALLQRRPPRARESRGGGAQGSARPRIEGQDRVVRSAPRRARLALSCALRPVFGLDNLRSC